MTHKHVLVVGSSSEMVGRLETVLASSKQAWHVLQADSVETARARLESVPVEVVVADIESPQLDGTAFLGQVKDSTPSVARIGLVRSGGKEGPRSISAVQQIIGFGSTDDQLREAIERTFCLQEVFAHSELQDVIGRLDRLPSVPTIYLQLTDLMSKSNAGMAEVAQIIQSDPAMTVKVLQLANSAFFGTFRKMSSIQEAASYLGLDMLRGLVLSAHVFTAFRKDRPGGFSLEAFQGFALRSGLLAKRFLAPRGKGDEAFTAGLLHDIGQMVIAVAKPEESNEVLRRAAEDGTPVIEVESELLGTTHAAVGAYLLGMWGLPFSILEAVAYHHSPGSVRGEDRGVLCAVHAADALIGIVTCGDPEESLDVQFLKDAGFGDELPKWRRMVEKLVDAA